jgi:diaminohydroxyphosphoribosylaminopyrimidine deaminase/5-amino-6-(5-phosphoribosylamino)uracil reductase
VSADENFMAQAISLAKLGRGNVEPNPMVGAVIVRDGLVIGQGYHTKFGGPHAEVQAIADARANGQSVRGATIYVSLEPCCHFGKTPPCTDAIIQAGITRVVAAMQDVDTRVAGRGLAILRSAGIDTSSGLLQPAAKQLLSAYITLAAKGRPWVICKWAQTSDGYLAFPPGQDRWISNELSRKKTHELRGLCQGILVGIDTVLADDPLLTNRSQQGSQPARVVLDSKLRLPITSQLARSACTSSVIVATTKPALQANQARADALRQMGLEILTVPTNPADDVHSTGLDLMFLLNELGRRKWTYLLVEGGAKVLTSFISAGLADEIIIFHAPTTVTASPEELAKLPRLDADKLVRQAGLAFAEELQLQGDLMRRFVRQV